MKKIICYGDSNTFGYNPKDKSRFDENTRWTSLLQKSLGTDYEVVNEGVCDRTGFVNNPKGFLYSAPEHFSNFIAKSEKFDLLILWLGTNDLQFQYNISTDVMEKGLEQLIKTAKEKAEKIIILPPVILNNQVLEGDFSYQFDETSIAKSRETGRIYQTIANVYQCTYFDINKVTTPSDIDGLHYDEISHKVISDSMIYVINGII